MLNIDNKQKAEILYDHYNNTFSYIKECIKKREKLFILAFVFLFINFLQIFFSEECLKIANRLLENEINAKSLIFIGEGFFSNILWFFLLGVVIRYFQINILINRQYDYIHKLEKKICKLVNDKNFLTREGVAYLKKYSFFSDWVHILYVYIFPSLLLLISLSRIIVEFIKAGEITWSNFISTVFFILIAITTILYLVFIKFKK